MSRNRKLLYEREEVNKRSVMGASGKQRPLLGAHTSIAHGLFQAVLHGEKIGCDIVQLFVKSPRQWSAAPLSDTDVALFREAEQRTGVKGMMAHASYLVNLASSDDRLYERSVAALSEEYERCGRLGIPYLIVHPGSYKGELREAGVERVARALARVARGQTKILRGQTKILIENTAGQGKSLGTTIEELELIIKECREGHHLGICFDTQHAFAAGYDLSSPKKYEAFWRKVDRRIGLDKVLAFHLNDSKTGLGSFVDRHERIGRGKMDKTVFQLLLNDRRFWGRPMSIETPKGKGYRYDMKAINILRSWIRKRG